jgi:DNA (cytosine-5)-methyltransferase 1
MSRPLLLDLFCGAGGAAVGYQRAGFDIVGVDIRPQPRYPFEFVQADAMSFPLDGFAAVHASPPCQAWSAVTAWRGDRSKHPKLIAATRARLTGHLYVIENVQDARHDLRDPIRLCGSQFGLPVRSHRYFEINPVPFTLMPPCHHQPGDASRDHGAKQTESAFRRAIGCEWMTVREARQAIRPAYTEWVGHQLLEAMSCEGWSQLACNT